MPSIFKHLTPLDKMRQSANEPEGSVQLKERLRQVGQTLVARRNTVSAVSITLIIAWLWLSHEPISEATQPVQQAISLPQPNSTAVPTVLTTPAIIDKPVNPPAELKASPNTTIMNKPVQQPATTDSNSLSAANQKAIELALAGQASLATSTLEQALLNDAQAGLVFDNLRRLYAGFASQSYQLALEPSKPKTVTVELVAKDQRVAVQLDTLNANTSKTTAQTSTLNTPPNTGATDSASRERVTDAPTPAMPTVSEKPASTSAVVKTPAPITEQTPAQKEAAQRKASQQAIHQAIKHWSEAWSKQDVKAYFASYAPSYSPKSTTRKAWMDYRQERILAPKRIKVELSDIKIQLIKPNLARVSFMQSYSSDTLTARDQKALELEQMNNAWLIVSESGR